MRRWTVRSRTSGFTATTQKSKSWKNPKLASSVGFAAKRGFVPAYVPVVRVRSAHVVQASASVLLASAVVVKSDPVARRSKVAKCAVRRALRAQRARRRVQELQRVP